MATDGSAVSNAHEISCVIRHLGEIAVTVRLFVYGTLRKAEVQLATYGRLVEGTPDALTGYRLEPLAITDPEVVRLSGLAVHSIARASRDGADLITGVVLELTPAELAATDAYEVDAYARVEVALDSGTRAFTYVGPSLERGLSS